MSRVWKQFFKNMALPVGIAASYIALSVIGGYAAELLGFKFQEGFIAVPLVAMCISFVGFLTYIEFDRARDKVKQENNHMMETLKDD